MKNFFKGIFSEPKTSLAPEDKTVKEPLFLTTSGLNFYIEKLIKDAQEYIYILSPYIKINTRLEELLVAKKKTGVIIYIVCRIKDTNINVAHFAAELRDRKNLHAKCFMSEKEAIIGSLNLYDFSQINNDEMGFYCQKTETISLYGNINREVKRIYDVSQIFWKEEKVHNDHTPSTIKHSLQCNKDLQKGKKYSLQELDLLFNFDYKKPSGIKSTQSKDIALFINENTKYQNKESGNTIYYEGQNTGNGPQQLIFGNKLLYDAYSKKECFFVFRGYVYEGMYYVCQKPFIKNDKWIFPIAPQQKA